MNIRISIENRLADKIDEMDDMFNLLLTDTNISNELLGQQLLIAERSGDSSYIHALIRMRVRATVSMLESMCFYFRHISRDLCILWRRELSEDYSKYDENQKYELKDKIKFSLRFLAFSVGKEINIDVSSGRWQKVCSLLDKRHTVTHPRNIGDLQVSEKDLENANITILWLCDFFYRLAGKEASKEYADLQKQILLLSK